MCEREERTERSHVGVLLPSRRPHLRGLLSATSTFLLPRQFQLRTASHARNCVEHWYTFANNQVAPSCLPNQAKANTYQISSRYLAGSRSIPSFSDAASSWRILSNRCVSAYILFSKRAHNDARARGTSIAPISLRNRRLLSKYWSPNPRRPRSINDFDTTKFLRATRYRLSSLAASRSCS